MGTTLHYTLHVFREGVGTGTAIVEAKLSQQHAVIKWTPLFHIFLDLRKVYDAMDREWCIYIMQGYGVSNRVMDILGSYWECQCIVTKVRVWLGREFTVTRDITQGEPVLTMISILLRTLWQELGWWGSEKLRLSIKRWDT